MQYSDHIFPTYNNNNPFTDSSEFAVGKTTSHSII